MKKTVIVAFLLAFLMCASAIAYVPSFSLTVREKNPLTWQPLRITSTTMNGRVILYNGQASFYGKGRPLTDYQLVYYGYGSHNDEWPYVTCIGEKMTSAPLLPLYFGGPKNGYMRSDGVAFDYAAMLNNGKREKFWVVTASDVDCDAHQFTAWNPSNYMFEMVTI